MLDRNLALKQLQNEINDYTIYTLLANSEKDDANRKILQKIAGEEKRRGELLLGDNARIPGSLANL